MSRADFLLEIGVEELPARDVQMALDELRAALHAALAEERLAHEGIDMFGTPRRLALLVRGLADLQADRVETVRGPALSAARDKTGGWSAAALGFCASRGVRPDELDVRDTPQGPYVFAHRNAPGRPASDVLAQLLPDVVMNRDWPRSMRFGVADQRFLRPIRWIVALYGDSEVPVKIAGLRARALTRGHRTLAPDPLPLGRAQDYVTQMREAYVEVDIARRRALVREQVEQAARDASLCADMDAALLDEVTQLVEYPTAFLGAFDPSLLTLPARVIATTMMAHQRYFPVRTEQGDLAPFFVGVRNGDGRQIANVVRGNEKVLSARLADAAFFYAEDLKVSPAGWREQLSRISYHEKLGSMADRERRIGEIARGVADALDLAEDAREDLDLACTLAKFDLATHMVRELPELQGYMGAHYARAAGAPPQAAAAVAEQYAPELAGSPIAESVVGQVLAVAEKAERLVGGFAVHGAPTGSQDPYGLRRAAMGIVRTLVEGRLELSLSRLVSMVGRVLSEDGKARVVIHEELEAAVRDFLSARVRVLLVDGGARQDLVDAIMAVRMNEPWRAALLADRLGGAVEGASHRALGGLTKRVGNLAAKGGANRAVDQALFEDDSERVLQAALDAAERDARAALEQDDPGAALLALLALEGPITDFFAAVMVMDDRDPVRRNRLALLVRTHGVLTSVLDLSRISQA